jgi:predicted secreted protein
MLRGAGRQDRLKRLKEGFAAMNGLYPECDFAAKMAQATAYSNEV